MNDYLASELIAQRQAALAVGLTHRAQLKGARAARKARAAAQDRPTRTRRLPFGRPAHAGA
ncbi:hypothetical protein [Trebonia sp.]|uniref:hypothetical protein n=1 Tax=Trebonia sp. TaxID=2767075 RepID=UPI00262CB9FA|nr:hypothetical protein [Trebonia sp.]